MIGRVSLQARLAALLLLLLAILWGGLLLQARMSAEASAREEIETRLRETSALLLSVSEETGFNRAAIDAVVLPALARQGAGRLDVPDFEVRQAGLLITRSARFPNVSGAGAGLSQLTSAEGVAWLVHTSSDETSQSVGRAALPASAATRRADEIQTAMSLPLVIALPAAALVLLGALWLGLRPLRRIEQEIAAIDPKAPAPLDIDTHALPRELTTLIAQFDRLMETVASALARQKAFASTAGHELRTPLAGARSQLDVLERSSDPAQLAHARATLAETLGRMDRLVTQLLMLARGESGRGKGAFDQVDLAALLREVREEFLEWRPEAEVILQGDTDPALLSGQEVLLRALFRNLLENGSNHGGDGALTVMLTSRGKYHEVSVEDEGPGFPATASADLFDPFVHPDGWQQGGTGLGLAVAKSVVDLHGGQIELLNRVNGGGAVRVTLPMRARGAAPEHSTN